jgi:dTDP-4-amino-4,6-dideoxygalactose transaminase
MTGKELWYIAQAHHNGWLAGDGEFSARCHRWLEHQTGSPRALLTHSCTAALEMTAMLAGVQPGDEVIMPSFTFVSTANAFVLRGAVPVFVDIRADTLNLDENLIEAAISDKTRAIVAVHYAGVGCEMNRIMEIANQYDLLVIEDAAQGLMSTYRKRPLGSMGHLGALSFHETKNITAGEGGALLVNDPALIDRAEIVREKGTNRNQFFRGQVDKYSWVDIGSSYLPSELNAAFLWAQMEEAESITRQRLDIWQRYHRAFAGAEQSGKLIRPIVPDHCEHNAHMYQLLLPTQESRDDFISAMKTRGVSCLFHYVPLHTAEAGKIYGRAVGDLPNTVELSGRLVRLPLWLGLEEQFEEVIGQMHEELA